MQTVRITDEFFHGVISLERTDAGISPLRLPLDELALYPSPEDGLVERARCPSGVRLRFATDSRRLVLGLVPADTGTERHVVDVTLGGEIVDSQLISPNASTVDFTLPGTTTTDAASASAGPAAVAGGATSVYDLWLHQFHPARLSSFRIDAGSALRPARDDRRRWLTYGSSITMCRGAGSPARTWPAVAARAHDLNLLNLGYGGQCHLDPMVARLIRDTPADVITLKLGINVYGGASLSARTYTGAVIGLVKIIRERHVGTPIGVITSIASPGRETTPNAVGRTLEEYRAMTRDAVARLRATGDDRLLLFEGTDLMSMDEAGLMPDGLHPDPEGYELIGRRVAQRVLPPLFEMLDS